MKKYLKEIIIEVINNEKIFKRNNNFNNTINNVIEFIESE